MADTIRTRAQILALLPDGSSQAISPQDLRDAIVSSAVYGGICVRDGAPVTQGLSTTPAKLTVCDIDEPSYGVVPDSTTDNDLTVPTGGDGDYDVQMSGSVSINATTTTEIRVRVNGSEPASLKVGLKMDNTSGTKEVFNAAGTIPLAAGDIVTAYVEVAAGSPTLSVYDLALRIRRLR